VRRKFARAYLLPPPPGRNLRNRRKPRADVKRSRIRAAHCESALTAFAISGMRRDCTPGRRSPLARGQVSINFDRLIRQLSRSMATSLARAPHSFPPAQVLDMRLSLVERGTTFAVEIRQKSKATAERERERERERTYVLLTFALHNAKGTHRVLVRGAAPDVLLPKNCFSANQNCCVQVGGQASRSHNGCLHLFVVNVPKTRERSGAYYHARMQRPRGRHARGGRGGAGAIGRLTPIQRGSVSATRVIGRAGAMHFDFYAEVNVL